MFIGFVRDRATLNNAALSPSTRNPGHVNLKLDLEFDSAHAAHNFLKANRLPTVIFDHKAD